MAKIETKLQSSAPTGAAVKVRGSAIFMLPKPVPATPKN